MATGTAGFLSKIVLEASTVRAAIQMALLQVCAMGCFSIREIQVSRPLTRDQKTSLSSRSFWAIEQVISSCLILTSCFDSSPSSAQDFCLSFSSVRLRNILVASMVTYLGRFSCTPVLPVWHKGTGVSATELLHALSHITSPQWPSEKGQSCDVLP